MSTVSSSSGVRDMDVPPIFSTVWLVVWSVIRSPTVRYWAGRLSAQLAAFDRERRLGIARAEESGTRRLGRKRLDHPVGPGIVDKEGIGARKRGDIAVRAVQRIAV